MSEAAVDNKAYLSLVYATVKELEASDGSAIILGFNDSIDDEEFEKLGDSDSDNIEVSKIDILNSSLSIVESYKNCEISRVLSSCRGSSSNSSYFVVLQEDKHLLTITDFCGRRVDIDLKDISLLGRSFELENIVSLFENQDDYVLIEGMSDRSDAYYVVNIVIDMSKTREDQSRVILHSFRDHRDSVEDETNKHRITSEYTDIKGDILLRFDCDNAIYIAFAGGHYLKFSKYERYISSGRFDDIVDLVNSIKPNVKYVDNECYMHSDEFSCRGFVDAGASIFKEAGDKYAELKNIDNIMYQHILPDIRFTSETDGSIGLYNKLGEQIELTNRLNLDDNIKYSVDFDNALRLLKFEYNQPDREKTAAEIIVIISTYLVYICELYRDKDGVVKQADLRYYKDVRFDRTKIMQFRMAESLVDGRPVIMIRSDEEVSIIDIFNKNGTAVHGDMAVYLEDNDAIYEEDNKRNEQDEQIEKFVDIRLGYNQQEINREKFSMVMQNSDDYLEILQDGQDF